LHYVTATVHDLSFMWDVHIRHGLTLPTYIVLGYFAFLFNAEPELASEIGTSLDRWNSYENFNNVSSEDNFGDGESHLPPIQSDFYGPLEPRGQPEVIWG